MSRVIVHLDADAFFASVEQASDPKLRGKPIAVGGEKRGIIASASYEARKFGVKTPMPTVQARRLCPKLIVLPGDYGRYEQFSDWMFGYAFDFTPDVEQTSIDEGYFDLTANRSKSPVDIAQTIRRAIQQKLKITVSEGIGSNKLISAVASKLRKPSAFEEVHFGSEADFLSPLPNHWLPGIGPKTAVQLNSAGLARIGQIAGTPIDLLELVLGNSARTLRDYARGVDERPLVAAREPQKSYGQQQTFGADLTDEDYAEAVLRRMADELFATLREEGRTIRTLTVKVRYNDMDEDQRSESLEEPTDLETDVYGKLRGLLRSAWKRRVSLRLVSLKLSQVYDGRFRSELALTRPAQSRIAHEKLSQAVDELRQKLGNQAVLRGHDLRLRSPPRELLKASPQILVKPAAPVRQVALRMHSHYSFLDSTLSPEDIVRLAGESGAVALTDDGNLHGAVPFALAAKKAGVKAVFGVELKTSTGPLLLYVENAKGYANLNRLLSTPRGSSDDAVATRQRHPVSSELLALHSDGLIAVSPDVRLARLYPGRFYQMASKHPVAGHPTVACPEVRHNAGERHRYDILQAIRTGSLLQQSHPGKRTGRLHIRSAEELAAVAKDHLDWLAHAREIADRCSFELPFGPPQFPAFHPPDGSSSREFLRARVMEGARLRYPKLVKPPLQLEEELRIIAEVGYDEYFLVVWELLQDCRAAGIDWITRGSAADSLVCYCLGISNVCPIRFDLYFKRFLNADRMALHKLPDIDVDFPHDRKDDVVKMLFARYGTERCAVVGGFSTFQARSAVADVAKVLGVSEHQIRRFTENFPWSFGGGWVSADLQPAKGERLLEMLRSSPECRDLPIDEEPFKTAIETAAFLDGSPRNPKMHPCGVVLSRRPMMELTPTFTANKGYPTTHADMDGVELLGLVKLDVLAQGGLAVMRDAQESIRSRGLTVDLERCRALGAPMGPFSPKGEIWEDPAVWDMIAEGGSRAVHHIESPAMVSLCRQTNVRDIDTLIGIVSVIRPGAANENKKLAFTRRYQGLEPTTYPHTCLEPCLRSTFGLVVYEEHILQICEVFAGMPAGRGDVLRRALVKQKAAVIEEFGGEFVAHARRQGHADDLILRVWDLVTGFSGYAFNKAHSTAYGVEAYQAAWLKRYFPAEFMAGVLTNGKGFYHPLVYVLECHRLGIRLLPPEANQPGPGFRVEGGSIRVPATRVKGLTERTQARWYEAREAKAFTSLTDFLTRVAPSLEEADALLRCGVFDCFGSTRTEQFWQLRHWLRCHGPQSAGQGWLLPPPGLELLPEVPLEEPTRLQRLQWETDLLGFVASGHPLDLFPDVAWDSYCPVDRLHQHVGQIVTTCGLVVEQRTHHQVTGEPMKFLSLADWTGIVETELFAQTYRSYGLASVRYPVLEVTAKVEPFENGRGFSLRVMRAGEPRKAA